MPRYLVLANQTLGGEQLMEEMRRRMATRGTSFHVLVPATRPTHRPDRIGAALVGIPSRWDMGLPDVDDEHRARLSARSRLEQLVGRIRAEGGEAHGEIVDDEPLKAIESVMRTGGSFDGIIISTLPTGTSRWLRMDLPHKLERRYKLPVTTVTAKPAN